MDYEFENVAEAAQHFENRAIEAENAQRQRDCSATDIRLLRREATTWREAAFILRQSNLVPR